MAFGEYLKSLRHERRLSQQQLAEMMYVDRSSVTRWESGIRMPDAVMITRLADVLGVDAGELLMASEKTHDLPTVIMVDDEKIFLTGGMKVLEEALPQATIVGFTKPSEALSFARSDRVSLAFLDIEIGQHSGLTLCRDLLSIDPQTNVIFLTAYADYALDAWSTGASGFLIKPLSAEAVREQLAKLRYPIRGFLK